MTRLTWDDPKTHIIRLGVDHGVVYPRGVKPISWNGLLSVIEQPSDGDQ